MRGALRNRTILSAALALIALLGCRPAYLFTDDRLKDLREHLKHVQFYISDEILLRREMDAEEKSVTPMYHSIRIEKTRRVSEITIPANTPGIVDRVEGDTIYLQFEPSPDGVDRAIPFQRVKEEERIGAGPGEGLGHVYQFRGKKIVYGGREYTVHFLQREYPVYHIREGRPVLSHYLIGDIHPILKINPLEESKEVEKVRTRVPGLRVRH